MEPPPALTVDRAKLILKESIEILDANKDKFSEVTAQVMAATEETRPMLKMQLMMPLVTQLVGGKLLEYGTNV